MAWNAKNKGRLVGAQFFNAVNLGWEVREKSPSVHASLRLNVQLVSLDM